jgi:transposase
LYRQWARKLDIVMRQEHRAGEKTFVDHAGQTVPVTDPKTGEVRNAYVFVAVLGASSYAYAEAKRGSDAGAMTGLQIWTSRVSSITSRKICCYGR